MVAMFMLTISFVLATETKITIKSDAEYVDARVYNYYDGKMVQKLQEELRMETDSDGEISFKHESGFEEITIITFTKEDEEGQIETFQDLKTGGEIYIDLTEEDPEASVKLPEKEIKNETTKVEEKKEVSETVLMNKSQQETIKEENQNKSAVIGITGKVVQNVKGNVIWYGVGFLVLVVVLFFLLKKKGNKENYEGYIKVRKMSDVKPVNIEETEKRIVQAEQEINRIKERDSKIRDAQNRYIQAKQDLDKLRNERL